MARVFVGIPTRNRARYVKEALESVRHQTFSDLRIVVSDNHSEQTCIDEVGAFIDGLHDPRVSYVVQPENRGQSGQILFLFGACREEYFALLDDDDQHAPHFLGIGLQTLDANQDLAFFSCNQCLIDERGTPLPEFTETYNADLGRMRLREGVVEDYLATTLARGVFSIMGTIFRTRVLRECGLFDHPKVYHVDFNIFVRLAERGKKGYWCAQALSIYRWHPEQTRRRVNWEFHEDMMMSYLGLIEARRYDGRAERVRQFLLSFACRRLAYIMLVRGVYGAAYGYMFRAIRADWRNWRMWLKIGFAMVFPMLVPLFWKNKVTLTVTPN